MTITVIKEGPYYVTEGTPISFSSLRTNFKGMNSGEVSASQLKRNTSTDSTNPTVPDATENVNISDSLNLKLSQFRNSIKRYKIKQSTDGGESAETNFDIGAQNWNSNLGKNIQKTFEVTGVIGATSTANAAATFNATAYNLTIDVDGHIYGKGGAAGTPNGVNGGNGGLALSVTNQVEKAITIYVRQNAKIYGGGGGGGAGTVGGTGGTGANGSKSGGTTSTYQTLSVGTRCSNQTFLDVKGEAFYFAYACAAAGYTGYTYTSIGVPQNCGGGHTDFLGTCNRTVTTNNADVATTGGVGGPGGNGANGGVGAGYGQALGAAGSGVDAVTDWTGRTGGTNAGTGGRGGKGGDSGAGGTFGDVGGPGTQGATGDPGGNGSLVNGTVTYGSAGTAGGLPFGTAGAAGRAITGTNYSVTGANADTVKGLYNP